MAHVTALLHCAISQPTNIPTQLFSWYVNLLPCKWRELIGRWIRVPILEEYSLIQIVVIKLLLIEVIQPLIIPLNKFRTQEVILTRSHFDHTIILQEREICLESLCHVFVVFDVFDEEELEDFLVNSGIDLFS